VPGLQAPDWQVSFSVHAFPSVQGVPFMAFGFEHMPVIVSQVPATWHWSLGEQTTGVPAQVPLLPTSPVVQRFPSLQEFPGSGECMHPLTVSQESAVHGLPSSQFVAHDPQTTVVTASDQLLSVPPFPAVWSEILSVHVPFGLSPAKAASAS